MAIQDPSQYFDATAELFLAGTALYSTWIHANEEEKARIVSDLLVAAESLLTTKDEILAAIAAREDQ